MAITVLSTEMNSMTNANVFKVLLACHQCPSKVILSSEPEECFGRLPDSLPRV